MLTLKAHPIQQTGLTNAVVSGDFYGDMAFLEPLKTEIRRQCDMRCCVCHAIGVEIHHIVPENDGGADTAENATPLCPTCHETYGANPTKRKFIREAKDSWYEVSRSRLSSGIPGVEQLIALASQGITRKDLDTFRQNLLTDLTTILHPSRADNKLRGQPLGQILEFIYDFTHDSSKENKQAIEFLFFFVWGDSLGNDEGDQTKKDFLDFFGRETAKRLCAYILHGHPFNLTRDGFTEEEMCELVHRLMITMILILHHKEVSTSQMRLDLSITKDSEILARALPPESTGPAESSSESTEPPTSDAAADTSRELTPSKSKAKNHG
jgi:hypothetical protein